MEQRASFFHAWDVSELPFQRAAVGECFKSEKFACGDWTELILMFYPKGKSSKHGNKASLYLAGGPKGLHLMAELGIDGERRNFSGFRAVNPEEHGFDNFSRRDDYVFVDLTILAGMMPDSFVWNVGQLPSSTAEMGKCFPSPEFSYQGVGGFRLLFYPSGQSVNTHASLFLEGPKGLMTSFRLVLDEVTIDLPFGRLAPNQGKCNIVPRRTTYKFASVRFLRTELRLESCFDVKLEILENVVRPWKDRVAAHKVMLEAILDDSIKVRRLARTLIEGELMNSMENVRKPLEEEAENAKAERKLAVKAQKKAEREVIEQREKAESLRKNIDQTVLELSEQADQSARHAVLFPLSFSRSQVDLYTTSDLEVEIQTNVEMGSTIFLCVRLRDCWGNEITCEKLMAAAVNNINMWASVPIEGSRFRMEQVAGKGIVGQLVILQCGPCKLHLYIGDDPSHVVGNQIALHVDEIAPTHIQVLEERDGIEKESAVIYDGQTWILRFRIVDSAGRYWDSADNIHAFASLKGTTEVHQDRFDINITTIFDPDLSLGKRKLDGGVHVKSDTTYEVSVTNSGLRGVYYLGVEVSTCGSKVLLDCKEMSFHALYSRDPRKWSPKDVILFIQRWLDVEGEVLLDEECEVNGPLLVEHGRLNLRDWLNVRREEREKLKKVEAINAEVQRFVEESIFADGPHKALLDNCLHAGDITLLDLHLGSGSKADVYKGIWKCRDVAIKLSKSKVDLNEAKKLEREVKKMKACVNENVVLCHGLVIFPGNHKAAIVMELCRESLATFFDGNRAPSWRERTRASLDAAKGILYLHDKRYAHLDLKPHNLLISSGGVVKVADFGLARRVDAPNSFTSCGAGTDGWMAPEQLRPGSDVGLHSDSWGFGCVLLFLITASAPWEGMDPAHIRTEILTNQRPPPMPNPIPTGCPSHLTELYRECCQLQEDSRPTFNTIVPRLQEILDKMPADCTFQFPHYWKRDSINCSDESHRLIDVNPACDDFNLVSDRLKSVLPLATIKNIQLNFNVDLYKKYFLERLSVAKKNGFDQKSGNGEPHEFSNEWWLWHGTRDKKCITSVVKDGFRNQLANMNFNYYGPGIYFATDARLSCWFTQNCQQRSAATLGEDRMLLLCQVSCGKIGEKLSLLEGSVNGLGRRLDLNNKKSQDWCKMQELMRETKHRNPPEDCQSVTGRDPFREDNTEIVIYDNYQAFPAYVVTFSLPSDIESPFQKQNPYLKSLDVIKKDL